MSAKCRSSIGQVSAKYQRSVGDLKSCRPTYMSVECWSTVDRHSIDSPSTEYRSSSGRLSTATSTDIAADIT